MEKIIQELDLKKDIAQMEALFKSKLSKSSYTNEQLEALKSYTIVKRHIGLQYILEKQIENNNFESSSEHAKKELLLKKIICGLGLWA
jgi:hypothetical protein